jgi:hypothetical protein
VSESELDPWPLELVRATLLVRRFARMDTTATIPIAARPMATTDRIGLLEACSWALARGSMARIGWGAGAGAMDGVGVHGTAIRVGVEPGMVTRDGATAADMSTATLAMATLAESVADTTAANIMLPPDSMVEAPSTAAVDFTEAVDSTAVADSTVAADAAKFPTQIRPAARKLPAFLFSSELYRGLHSC